MHLLEANKNKICPDYLSSNPNIKAIDMLKNIEELNIDEAHFEAFQDLYTTEKNIDIMDKTIDTLNISEKISFISYLNSYEYYLNNLMLNPNVLLLILEWDYDRIKTHFYSSYGKGIIEWIYNPKNFNKWSKNCWDLDI